MILGRIFITVPLFVLLYLYGLVANDRRYEGA